MNYAPILIPTLCRYEHFVRCIESLKRNTWAKYTDVYIALDYPAKEIHWDGYNKICEYLEQKFDEFANFYVIRRPYNYGALRNMVDLRNDIFQKYDRYIRTDDDCEFAPAFLEYMNKCLEKYKDDESVLGITGYSYPVQWNMDSKCNALKNAAISPMWGTGFWKDKYIRMQKEIESGYIKEQFLVGNVKRKYMTDARYLDAIEGALKDDKDNLLLKLTDVSLGCYIQLKKKYIITPRISLVRNYGFDGSGIYCQNTSTKETESFEARTYNYEKQAIDMSEKFELQVDEYCNSKKNYDILNKFDKRKGSALVKSTIKSKIKKIIYVCYGKIKYLKK